MKHLFIIILITLLMSACVSREDRLCARKSQMHKAYVPSSNILFIDGRNMVIKLEDDTVIVNKTYIDYINGGVIVYIDKSRK